MIAATSPAAWRTDPMRNAALRGGFEAWAGAKSRQQLIRSLQTLLPESSRRVGTAWPGRRSNECSAARNRFVNDSHVAVHNSLKLLAELRFGARSNVSSCCRRNSSRQGGTKVEIVNHPRAVSSSLARGGQSACPASGGWGAPYSDGLVSHRGRPRRLGIFERGVHDASTGGGEQFVSGPRSLRP